MALRLGLLLTLLCWPLTARALQEPLTFSGIVERGETYEQVLQDDLVFRLRQVEYGWAIWLGDPENPEDSYSDVATPPFRGTNPMVINGWHFRNSDNDGPNVAGPGNINAPQQVRNFRFIANRDAFEAARDPLQILISPDGRSEAEVAAAEEDWRAVPAGEGTLEITLLALGNLAPGKRAWIDRLDFTVTLQFPED